MDARRVTPPPTIRLCRARPAMCAQDNEVMMHKCLDELNELFAATKGC